MAHLEARPHRRPAGPDAPWRPDRGAVTVTGLRLGPQGRALALLLAVALAYNYSLLTLVRGVSLQTPLAYLAIVPIMALVLARVRLVGEPAPLPVHDRQVDYIVGIACVAAAIAITVLLPQTLATTFWLGRYDLLSLPLFVAGLVALLYGVRRLWALKVPIAFLLLAWPVPYGPLLGDGMRAFTDVTATLVARLTAVIPAAVPAPGDETLFFVGSHGAAFAVSIGAACSGVNSLVGFVLMGGVLAYAVRGAVGRKMLWLGAGLVVVWLLNVVRIEAILIAGAMFGQGLALGILHPVVGLVVFNLGVLGMLVSAPRLGLRFVDLRDVRPGGALAIPSPVRRAGPALLVCAVLAVGLGLVNAGYARYEAISAGLGVARLPAFDIRAARLDGWSSALVARFDQGREFFGASSTWERVSYSSGADAGLRSSVPLYLDVITTPDSGALAAYGLEACYQFHGHRIESIAGADIGAGTTAQVIDYRDIRAGTDWSAIWWEWPYAAAAGNAYERIVIFVRNGPAARFEGGAADLATPAAPRFDATDRFLVALARAMVATSTTEVASR